MIFIIAGVVISLALTLLIIKSIRRIYKPARPRIKKTFVVQKKVSQTPLTSRPMSTEQCEITIENCCNMNICDTVSFIFIKLCVLIVGFMTMFVFLSLQPCFDPKLLQQNLSCESTKEDKKILINHMDEDLY